MGDVPECLREKLVFRITDALAEGPVHLQHATVEADKGHADRRGFESVPEPALALSSTLLRLAFCP